MIKWFKKVVPRPLKRALKLTLSNMLESTLYGLTRWNADSPDVKHIIFVCKGNICRSPFAEKYLRNLLDDTTITIESCGLDVDQGGASPIDAILTAKEFGVELGCHVAKGISTCDFDKADLILSMEYQHYRRLKVMFPQKSASLRLLRDYAPLHDRFLRNIHDPYGLGPLAFRSCFRQIAYFLTQFKKKVI